MRNPTLKAIQQAHAGNPEWGLPMICDACRVVMPYHTARVLYVPAIGDAFKVIDRALALVEEEAPADG